MHITKNVFSVFSIGGELYFYKLIYVMNDVNILAKFSYSYMLLFH